MINGTDGNGITSFDVNLGAQRLTVRNIPGVGSQTFTVENFDNVFGTPGSDILIGDAQGNARQGRPGNDTIRVENGDDVIGGGEGADSILGGFGSDILEGNAGKDFVSGNQGNDRLGGNDKLLGGQGNDILLGGNGNDELLGQAGKTHLMEALVLIDSRMTPNCMVEVTTS